MTARRAARARTELVSSGRPPMALLIGPATDVWRDPKITGVDPLHVSVITSSRHRWSAARAAWLASVGINDPIGFSILPSRPGRPVTQAKLHGLGLTRSDVPRLIAQAEALVRGT